MCLRPPSSFRPKTSMIWDDVSFSNSLKLVTRVVLISGLPLPVYLYQWTSTHRPSCSVSCQSRTYGPARLRYPTSRISLTRLPFFGPQLRRDLRTRSRVR